MMPTFTLMLDYLALARLWVTGTAQPRPHQCSASAGSSSSTSPAATRRPPPSYADHPSAS